MSAQEPGRVRLAVVLPTDGPLLSTLVTALPRLTASADLVLVGPSHGSPIELAQDVDDIGAALARGASGQVRLEATPDAALALARMAARAGRVDGVLAAPAARSARLHIREGVRVIEPSARPFDVATLAAAIVAAHQVLQRLGAPRPRLVVFEPEGQVPPDRLAAALEAARESGVELVGPLAPGRAVLERQDALLAWTRAQLELPLTLLGSGPTTLVDLTEAGAGDRTAWADPLDGPGLAAASTRLVTWARAHGPSAAAREAEARRAPVVAVRVPTTTPAEPRCPYCRRRVDEPPGDAGPPGPPIVCAGCTTQHHRDCIAEHGGCTALGCSADRGLRLGVSLPYRGLGLEAPARRPFLAAEGGDAGGTVLLRIEAAIDDPAARPTRRSLALELPRRRAERGELVQGFVALHTPRPLRVRGGILRVRALITTRPLEDTGAGPTMTPILDREAVFVGDAPGGALSRLQDGVLALFGGAAVGLEVPAGVRRWPISFRLAQDHPATLTNRRGAFEERVRTTLAAVLDSDVTEVELDVT